jgi:dienelactone hydrolase
MLKSGMRCFLSFIALLVCASLNAAEIRRIPPPGIPVPDADRAELTAGVEALRKELEHDATKFFARDRLERPDIEIFLKAVDWALRYDEFFDAKQIPVARDLLAQGNARLASFRKKEAPWNSATGLVVRAYESNIDGSVQPYGLVIPASWKPDDGKKWRLDFWLHGRGEKLSELAFIDDRQRNRGEFAPDDAIVCHLYGRFCNANKFAGERDLFEALWDIQQHYNIDHQRLVVRGFSMGGAACWQFATHYPKMWAAAAPGAGFAETAEFFKVFAEGKTPPPWWEQVLWRWYDCTTMAANLTSTKVIAYSGEIDGQKQAADIMVKYAKEEGIEFPHIIGPQTGHKYHPDAKPKIEEFISAAAAEATAHVPTKTHVTTYSLIYQPGSWCWITGMEKQWERADLDGEMQKGRVVVKTKNVTRFDVGFDPTQLEKGKGSAVLFDIDGQTVRIEPQRRLIVGASFIRHEGRWQQGILALPFPFYSSKRPEICGPIDHAFMKPFVFVAPTGEPLNETVGKWTQSEMTHAIEFWRRVFRGDAPVKKDTEVTQNPNFESGGFGMFNLVLWGDPSSNAVLKRIIDKLPIKWTKDTLEFNGVKYDARHHAPIFIFPNPLNPLFYVVINSGPTFREEALLNNSDQTPKLPDWAIVNIDTPPDGKWPGQIIDAGFFDEQWALPKN